jgi:hypothetical protein
MELRRTTAIELTLAAAGAIAIALDCAIHEPGGAPARSAGGPAIEARAHAHGGALPNPAMSPRSLRGPRSWIWGVTVDDVWSLDATVESLGALSARPMARIVFDRGVPAKTYHTPVARVRRVGDVMGELLDSQFVASVDVPAYTERAREYLDVLGASVDIWEVGNEVNGEWLGATPDVVAKVRGAFAEVEARGGSTAMTLYYNEGCWALPDHEMFTWAEANVPATMKDGLDYVFVSYYEDDCHGRQPDWSRVFSRLAHMFPNSALGFGECGTAREADKRAYLTRYYGLRPDEGRFVGGYFWWYFSHDMVPKSRPLWRVLDQAMAAPNRAL